MQVDWKSAAKSKDPGLTQHERLLREETRQALLHAFAPTLVLNQWAEAAQGASRAPKIVDLPDLHPMVARGVVEWVEKRTSPFPNEWWATFYKVYGSIKRAAGTQKPPAAS